MKMKLMMPIVAVIGILGFITWRQEERIESLGRVVSDRSEIESLQKEIGKLEEFRRSVEIGWRAALEARAAKNEERFVNLEREIESRVLDVEAMIPEVEEVSPLKESYESLERRINQSNQKRIAESLEGIETELMRR